MDTSLPELSGVAVLFPVVVPVSPAVCPETKHIHLEESRRVGRQDACDSFSMMQRLTVCCYVKAETKREGTNLVTDMQRKEQD